MASYKVVKGDCLWTIAENKLGSGLKWVELAKLNDISISKPIIYPGQILNLDIGTTPTPPATTTTSMAEIQYFGLQAGTDNTIFATWSWNKSKTENYRTIWYYDTGTGVWFVGNDSKTVEKQSIYSAPSNAKNVKFKVQPQAMMESTYYWNTGETRDILAWTASWSTEKEYSFSDNPPKAPPVPTVKIEKYKLTASLNNLEINATEVQFQVVRDNTVVFDTGTATITTDFASYSCNVDVGSQYKVRARGHRDRLYGGWSEYSNNETTIPSTPSGVTVCKAMSETSVYLEWTASNTATKYDIEYTTEQRYFDGSNETTVISGVETTHYEKTGLESGKEYFFRVRAVNSVGESSWSGFKSTVIGVTPVAPTTWSSSTTVITGELLTLCWVHNTKDGSSQTYAEVEVIVNGVKNTYTVKNTTDENEKDKTSFYDINTSTYVEGVKIQWRIRTAGVTKAYGEWSVQRVVDIYAPPTLQLNITNVKGEPLDILKSFPFYVSALTGPKTQRPIGYHLTITADESYETIDNIGNVKMVNRGTQVYSKYFSVSDSLFIEMSAFNTDLENNIEYVVTCRVTMDSGLTAENSVKFKVAWVDEHYSPNAEIGVDMSTYAAYIRPYCENELEESIAGVKLSVYRREFDGTFTELAVGLDNTKNTFISDPHPSLDYARYRIVAVTESTGAVSYYDPPGYPIGEKAVIIQWDENWTKFETTTDDILEPPPWPGSLLKLPYNINITNNHALDISLVEYIGRQHPVSYYGTQIGETATWSMDVEKHDKETIYALRRLARWMGDVYVREPSGSGYWASISVSFTQTHREVTVPVTLTLTRVEGGV